MFCKQGVKSADYSTLCMTTVSEDNTYASVITNKLPSEDKKAEVKKEGKKAYVHIHWLAVFAFLIAILVNIAELKAATDQLQKSADKLNTTNELNYQQLSQEYQMAIEVMYQYSRNATQEQTNELTELLMDLGVYFTSSSPALSCNGLSPSSPSGYYWVRALNGSAVRVYCDMTRECGNITGAWTRVKYLDMTNSGQQCPTGFILHSGTDSNRTCVAQSSNCSSITIDIPSTYSNVCGRVLAYQVGTTNAFRSSRNDTIDDVYIDGVSLTHGRPRKHI